MNVAYFFARAWSPGDDLKADIRQCEWHVRLVPSADFGARG